MKSTLSSLFVPFVGLLTTAAASPYLTPSGGFNGTSSSSAALYPNATLPYTTPTTVTQTKGGNSAVTQNAGPGSTSNLVAPGAPGSGSGSGSGQGPAGSSGGSGSNSPAPSVSIMTVVVTEHDTVTAPACAAGTPGPVSSGGAASGSGSSASPSGGWSSNGATYTAPNSSSSNNGFTADNKTFVNGPTLLPAVHWDYPVNDIRNLAPINSSDLYYTVNGVADANVQHLFASLSTTLQYDSVVLDHSSFVKDVSCSVDGILVTFESSEAFNFACSSWSTVQDFVLVTYTDGCGASDEQRTFWLIDSLKFLNDSMSILADVEKELAIEDAIDGVDMVWGTYYPPGSNFTTNTTSSSTSSSGSSSSGPGTGGNGVPGGTNSTSSSSNSTTSTSSSGNSTSDASNGVSCGAPPSSTIDGFPAAACGASDFDTQLDNALGYLDFSSTDYDSSLADFAPDVSFDSEDETADDASLEHRTVLYRRHLRKRGFLSAFKSIVSTGISLVAKAATAPLQLATAAVKAIPVVGNLVSKATEFDPSVHGTANITLGPNDSATSPWGAAAELYTKSSTTSTTTADVTLYCVNCGLKGQVSLAGAAKWNVLDGLHALSANINANLEAGLNLGLVAAATFKDTKTKSLINAPIPDLGVAVTGIFSAGVFVAVDAVATIDIEAQGQALVGITMLIPNFQASLNLLDATSAAGSSITGYTPTFKKTFEASGQITASATLALPISLNVGIQVIPLNFKKSLALIEQPSLYGNVSFAASTADAAPASTTCNNGFAYFANAQNDVNFDFFGLKTFNLNHYASPPLLQGCKLLDGSSSTGSGPTGSAGSGDSSGSGGSTSSGDSTSTSGTDGSSTDTNGQTSNSGSTSDTSTSDENGSNDETTGDANTDDTTTTSTSGDGTSQDGTSTASTTSNDDTTQDSTKTTATENSKPVTQKRQITDSGTVIDDDSEDAFASDSADDSDDTDDPVDDQDATDDPDNAEYAQDSSEAESASAAASTDDGFTYTTISELHNAFSLVPDEDGNLYAGAPSTGGDNGTALFATYENVIVGDDGDMVLHYYPDVMKAYNASRIRLSYEDHIPKGSDVIMLMLLDYDPDSSSNPNIMYAVDTNGDTYSLVLCDFSNGADSKLFIVSDQTGVENLSLEKLRYTVTGAPVDNCDLVALVAGSGGSTSSSGSTTPTSKKH